MIKRVLFLWLLTTFIGTVFSCSDHCGGPLYYGIGNITGIPVIFTEGQPLEDTVAKAATLPYHQYALLITTVPDYRTQSTPSGGGWFQRAYACDPAVVPTDELAAIVVTSDTDFTATDGQRIKADTSLTPFFETRSEYGIATDYVASYVNDLPAPAKEFRFALVLARAPAEPQLHQFTVHYQLTDGRAFSVTLPPVTITP